MMIRTNALETDARDLPARVLRLKAAWFATVMFRQPLPEKHNWTPKRDADSAPPSKPKDNVPRGILFMIVATLLFAVSNAIMKWQVATYPVGEVMFFRSFFSLV